MSAPAPSLLKNPQSHWPHDAHGSIRAITNASGSVVGSFTYGIWGDILSASHPSGFTMPYLFCGAYGIRHEASTGLYYIRNRWYDAGLGRFLSRDSVRYTNRYAYAANKPNDCIDVDGRRLLFLSTYNDFISLFNMLVSHSRLQTLRWRQIEDLKDGRFIYEIYLDDPNETPCTELGEKLKGGINAIYQNKPWDFRFRVVNGSPDVQFDRFYPNVQLIDVGDFTKLDNDNPIIAGSWLSHAIAEAREGQYGRNVPGQAPGGGFDYPTSHRLQGIPSERRQAANESKTDLWRREDDTEHQYNYIKFKRTQVGPDGKSTTTNWAFIFKGHSSGKGQEGIVDYSIVQLP